MAENMLIDLPTLEKIKNNKVYYIYDNDIWEADIKNIGRVIYKRNIKIFFPSQEIAKEFRKISNRHNEELTEEG